jgi:hypothetical protein
MAGKTIATAIAATILSERCGLRSVSMRANAVTIVADVVLKLHMWK